MAKHKLAVMVMGKDLYVELSDGLSAGIQKQELKKINHLLAGVWKSGEVRQGTPLHDDYYTCRSCGAKMCDCGMYKCHDHYAEG